MAPSDQLRRWFAHDPAKWPGFSQRYWRELNSRREQVLALLTLAQGRRLTLIYGAKDRRHNHARVLQAYLSGRQGPPGFDTDDEGVL